MKHTYFKHTLAFIMCLALVCTLFTACSKKPTEDEGVTEDASVHAAHWAVSPSIEAEAIEPLVRADFNETTSHYDISYADYFRIKQNGKYGIIDLNGKIVVKPEYDELFAIRNSRNFLGVKVDSDGDRRQTYIHCPTFEKETAHKKYNSEKYEYYWNTGLSKPMFMKTENGKTEKGEYKSEVPETLTGVMAKSGGGYKPNGTYGLYSMGRNITGMVYSGAGQFSDGKAAFKSGDKWGYIDSNGRTVIPFEYEAIPGYSALGGDDTPYESFNGFVTLCKDGMYGILKSDGTVVAPFSYEGATPVVNGAAFVLSEGKWGVLVVDSDASAVDDTAAAEQQPDEEITSEVTEKPDGEKTTEEKTEETTDEDSEEETTEESTRKSEYSSGYYNMISSAYVRSSADTDSDNIVGSVSEGDSIYVDRVDGQWGHISGEGNDGWVYLGLAEKD